MRISRRVSGQMLAACLLVASAHALRGQATVTSTPQDRKSIALTVYNTNLAFVRDVRQVQLPAGEVRLRLRGVPAKINPSSVHLISQAGHSGPVLIEQQFNYNLLTPSALLKKYVGKELTLVEYQKENGSTKKVSTPAKLLADNSSPVWQIDGKVVTGIPHAEYVFPRMPADFETHPTLVWLLRNPNAGRETLEFSYLTGGLSWSADYVLTLAPASKTANLSGWVSLRNESGTAFKDAELQLVAGNVHRSPAPVMESLGGMQMAKAMATAPTQFSEAPLSDYHLYSLAHPTTLRNNQSKQIALLAASGVHISKTYEVSGQSYYYQSPLSTGETMKDPVQVHIKFENDKADSLGIPMPAGTVRVEQEDTDGGVQFIGEDQIPHTPAGEKVNAVIGNAFDISETRKQTSFQRITNHETDAAFEITIRNQKSKPVTVEVNERFGGDWTITQSNLPYHKTSAFSARFSVPVKAKGKSVLDYQVRVLWP